MQLTLHTTKEEIKNLKHVYQYILYKNIDINLNIYETDNSFIIDDNNFDVLLETIVESNLPRYDNLLFMLINSDFMTPMSLDSMQNPII